MPVIYLHESESELSINNNDPVTFSQVVNCDNFEKFLDAIKEDLKSMEHNDVWSLLELPNG